MTDDPHIIIEHPQWAHRNVTLICGPPGAGKTTLALKLHAATLDIGDLLPGSPRKRMARYARLAAHIGRTEGNNLAVVRCAAIPAERTAQQRLVHPARTIILLTDAATCHERIIARNRTSNEDGRDVPDQLEALAVWWTRWAP